MLIPNTIQVVNVAVTSATTLYTVPAGMLMIIREIRVTNKTGTQSLYSLAISGGAFILNASPVPGTGGTGDPGITLSQQYIILTAAQQLVHYVDNAAHTVDVNVTFDLINA